MLVRKLALDRREARRGGALEAVEECDLGEERREIGGEAGQGDSGEESSPRGQRNAVDEPLADTSQRLTMP